MKNHLSPKDKRFHLPYDDLCGGQTSEVFKTSEVLIWGVDLKPSACVYGLEHRDSKNAQKVLGYIQLLSDERLMQD
jgi:hypothetical protein